MSDELKNLGAEALAKAVTEQSTAPKKGEERKDLTPKEAEDLRKQKKARLTQVLSRGIINEKLETIMAGAVPEGRVGKYVRDSEEDIVRYQNLGFSFQYKDNATGLHGSADNRIRVGDLVLMTIDKEDSSILKEIRHERVKQNMEYGRKAFMEAALREAESGGPVPFEEA